MITPARSASPREPSNLALLMDIAFGLVCLVNGLMVLYEPFLVYRVGFLFQIPRWAGVVLVYIGVYAIVATVGRARRRA